MIQSAVLHACSINLGEGHRTRNIYEMNGREGTNNAN